MKQRMSILKKPIENPNNRKFQTLMDPMHANSKLVVRCEDVDQTTDWKGLTFKINGFEIEGGI